MNGLPSLSSSPLPSSSQDVRNHSPPQEGRRCPHRRGLQRVLEPLSTSVAGFAVLVDFLRLRELLLLLLRFLLLPYLFLLTTS